MFVYVSVDGATPLSIFRSPVELAEVPSNVHLLPDDPGTLDNYWWDTVNEELVAYTPLELETKANPPSVFHTWNPSTKTWADNRTLAEAKAQQRALIDEEKNAPVETVYSNGDYFTLTTRDIAELALVGVRALHAQINNQGMTLEWPNRDGTAVTFGNATAIVTFVRDAAARVASIGTYRTQRFTTINNAGNNGDVTIVDWDPPPPEP